MQFEFPKPNRPFEAEVAERHAKVAEIISRHLAAIHDEILALDPETMNIDDAGDKAEIARQVLVPLVEQLRGFSASTRVEVREDIEMWGEEEGQHHPDGSAGLAAERHQPRP